MGKRKIDLTGQQFGRLRVLHEVSPPAHHKERRVRYLCQCLCGNTKEVISKHLVSGATTSCGCLRVDTSRDLLLKHGLSQSPTYHTYKAMRARCYNRKNPQFKDYGGRGIRVCDRWLNSFEAFVEDMGVCPDGLTIDRINNDGDYEPGNCRWATRLQQARNKRSNRTLTYQGITKTAMEWALETDRCPQSIAKRIREGLPPEEILFGDWPRRTGRI